MNIKQAAWAIHSNAVEKGWYDGVEDVNDPTFVLSRLALIHTEVSEACEDVRTGAMTTELRDDGKPVGFPSELADIVIRVFDVAESMGIDIESEIVAKHSFNRTRPYKHGKLA